MVRRELGALNPVALELLVMELDVAVNEHSRIEDQREQQQIRIGWLRHDRSVVTEQLERTIEALTVLKQLTP